MLKVQRHFLEIKLNFQKKGTIILPQEYKFSLEEKSKFIINKFFYKQIGMDHYWRDRLIWTDKEWLSYCSKNNFETWVIKKNDDLVGFYEQEYHPLSNEVELINMGVLKEYRGKKLGSALLYHSIEMAFKKKPNRMWVHTCSLDHKYALKNYLERGFKIFKKEEINFIP
ncbi:GNAT family N-acetyltransferase [Pelagibacteraceae bacterium]|nr:GNAT family N-acetyltransferase [Pelagibacteraceae bacterium]